MRGSVLSLKQLHSLIYTCLPREGFGEAPHHKGFLTLVFSSRWIILMGDASSQVLHTTNWPEWPDLSILYPVYLISMQNDLIKLGEIILNEKSMINLPKQPCPILCLISQQPLIYFPIIKKKKQIRTLMITITFWMVIKYLLFSDF